MKIEKQHGVYGEGDVYTIYSLEEWDEYENLLKTNSTDFLKFNPNFYSFKEDFIKYIGKIWQDEKHEEYKVIAIQDDNSMADWYWVLQNVNDENNVKYLLANSYDLQEGLKI